MATLTHHPSALMNNAASSNVVFVPMQQPPFPVQHANKKFVKMPVESIRVLSIMSIIAGVASIGIQLAALCINLYYSRDHWFDVVGHGFWAGTFYMISGGLGLGAASKKTKGLLVSTVVMASVSIPASIIASVLSWLTNAAYHEFYSYGSLFEAWYALEWALLGVSIFACCTSIVLMVLASVGLCNGRPNAINTFNGQYHVPMAYANMGIVNPGYQTFEVPAQPEVRSPESTSIPKKRSYPPVVHPRN